MLPPETLWQALQEERPLAARLAMLSCLPVRVSPAFLRLARLRLAAQAGTGDEADLWLSDLVETRSSAGLSYRRGVRELLRQRLAAEATLLEAVWNQVHLVHAAWLAPRTRLEEELTWRLLRDPADPWMDERWRAVLEELDSGPNPEGVARWVVRAVPDLPPGTLDFESGRRAYFGASLLLGDASVLGNEVQTFLDTDRFAFATRRLPRRRIHVGRVEGGLLLSPLQPIEQGFELDVPATRPLWLQVEGRAGAAASDARVITLAEQEAVTCETGSDTSTLRLIDGSAYSIGPPRVASQEFIARSRQPRVQIEYELERYGIADKVQLPFVMGVFADLSGRPSEPLPLVVERKFLEIDVDNFDSRMSAVGPRVAFAVPNTLTGEGSLAVDLTFESLEDFSPAAVARRVEGLRQLLESRRQLFDFTTYMDGKAGARELIAAVLKSRALLKSLAGVATSAAEESDEQAADNMPDTSIPASGTAPEPALQGIQAHGGEFVALLRRKFMPRTGEAMAAIEAAVQTLAEQVLANGIQLRDDPLASIEALVTNLDRRLSEALDTIVHHPDFQKLEGAWRGLHYLVINTETDEMLKIRFISISKGELARALSNHDGPDWEQSPIFRTIYSDEYDQFGGQPYGVLVGDFEFDHTAPDTDALRAMSRIAAAAFTPFLAAASPTLLQMASWQELANPRDMTKLLATPEYAAWRSLRESPEAAYVGLAMPRFLARLPYGAKTNPVEDFSFEEDTGGGDVSRYVWLNAAYAMAVNINRAFKLYGWCASIRGVEGGGVVGGLPTHAFPTDDGGVDMRCPTEIAISDRREAELARSGFMPLVHRRNSDSAAFLSAHSLHKPAEYEDPDATANANLAARLPYTFASCRFAHYLKCIVRDKIGSFHDPESMRRYLDDWITNYIDGDPANSPDHVKALRPLAAGGVEIEEPPEDPAYYAASFYIQPHYQLEGLTAPLRLISKLPSLKAG